MTDRDYGYEAQQAAEKHLEACETALIYEGDPDRADLWPEDMAGPYDGCLICQVRETLHAAWPIIEEYVRNNPDGPT